MKKKVFIVFLGDYRFDARCVNMLNTLVSKKNKVTICHFKDTAVVAPSSESSLLKEICLNPGNTKFIKYIFWCFLVYWKLSPKASGATIIASDLYSLVPVCFLKTSKKIIYDSREIYSALAIHYKNPIKNLILRYLEKFCVANVSTIITTAPSDEKYLKTLYKKFQNIHYEIIYNYPRKILKKRRNFIRSRFNISDDKIILLYQGVLQRGRGICQLLKIVQNMKNTVAVIIGGGEEENLYKNLVQKEKLSGRVYFISKIPYSRLLEITASADIGIALIRPLSISFRLALPNKIFEYAAAGLPCLASNLPNMQYYINKYNLGKVVNPYDIKEQEKAITELLSFDKKTFLKLNNLSWKSQSSIFYNLIVSS